ncbi:hypothetical protein RI367_002736 [Sorochytrium milnesiophthora]
MARSALVIAALLALLALVSAQAADNSTTTAAAPTDSQRRVIGYFYPAPYPDTPKRQRLVDLDGDRLTHLLYAFANPMADATVSLESPDDPQWLGFATSKNDQGPSGCNCKGQCLQGYLGQLVAFKRRYPHVKTIMSIGGWTWSKNFSDTLGTPDGRQRFVESATKLMRQHFFDGIDIDWEFPGGARQDIHFKKDDWASIASTLELFRSYWAQQFGANNAQQFLLSTCIPAVLTPSHPLTAPVAQRLSNSASFLLQMAYEYHHNNVRTRHLAALTAPDSDDYDERLQTVMGGVASYLGVGVSKDKLVVGMPLYGSGFYDFKKTSPDCFQAPIDNKNINWELNAISYLKIQALIKSGAFPAAKEDMDRGAASICNGTHFYSFDTPNTIKLKSKWVDGQNLGGIMLWDLSQDFSVNSTQSLHAAITSVYQPSKPTQYRKNMCVSSKETNYCNVACSSDVKDEFELQSTAPAPVSNPVLNPNPSNGASNSANGNGNGAGNTGQFDTGNSATAVSSVSTAVLVFAFILAVFA